MCQLYPIISYYNNYFSYYFSYYFNMDYYFSYYFSYYFLLFHLFVYYFLLFQGKADQLTGASRHTSSSNAGILENDWQVTRRPTRAPVWTIDLATSLQVNYCRRSKPIILIIFFYYTDYFTFLTSFERLVISICGLLAYIQRIYMTP